MLTLLRRMGGGAPGSTDAVGSIVLVDQASAIGVWPEVATGTLVFTDLATAVPLSTWAVSATDSLALSGATAQTGTWFRDATDSLAFADAAPVVTGLVVAAADSLSFEAATALVGEWARVAAGNLALTGLASETLTPAPPTSHSRSAPASLLFSTVATAVVVGSSTLYLGRFRVGDTLPLAFAAPALQPRPVTVTVFDESLATVIDADLMASTDGTAFILSTLIPGDWTAGRYTAVYSYISGGSTDTTTVEFDVIPGGDPAGGVFFMSFLRRPQGAVMLAQTASGQLFFGRNPRF